MDDVTELDAHSAEYFGEARDYWWNDDFLRLMASRWGVDGVERVLDVGCGIGHWSRALLPVLRPSARLIGVDPEAKWVDEAHKRAERAGLRERATYRLGKAEKLPFHDNVFDMVTCQTLLIHVPDVMGVLREMVRVLKPGGLLVVAEPNNSANAVTLDNMRTDAPVEQIIEEMEMFLRCERGKRALGEGDNSVGELLPGHCAAIGLRDICVYLSDKAWGMFPPYREPRQRAFAKQAITWAENGVWAWSKDETRRYYLAGGGTEEAFPRLWEAAGRYRQAEAKALREETYVSSGGSLVYLVSGRKAEGASVPA